ncbi:hypothetical protein [Actinomadura flavalba]|uniref:hypothetical protein n=1 Tax=Actinomadura flavalba TaxID=1120938 RepID=UPI000376D271|nr:hypothetical protein [Actinomadura flavalba]
MEKGTRSAVRVLLVAVTLGALAASGSSAVAQPARTQVGGQNCRTYAGETVCGTLRLSPAERACVRDAVSAGMTQRRAEVECHLDG